MQPVFEADGQPAALLKSMQSLMESLETEVQRTRLVGKRLLELDVLREMRFDATLPDGSKHSVDGFLTVDDKKMTALPDAVIAELHRNGMLGLVHLHWVSLGNMRSAGAMACRARHGRAGCRARRRDGLKRRSRHGEPCRD